MSYRIGYLYKFLVLLITIFSSPKVTHSQFLTPITLNNGGGTGLGIEWSMGESVSIANFYTPSLLLTTGVLQPNTSIVTGITDFGPSVFGNDITMGPNPVINLLHIKASFKQMGDLSFQILDANSTILKAMEAGIVFNTYEKDIDLAMYTGGIIFVRVLFKPIYGTLKKGIYKIIKL
jgi:hypothetical protein